MTELRVSHLIDEADEILDNKLHVGSYCLFMNTDELQDILGKIKAILPEEIKTAEMILKRRDDIFIEAQSRADRIISEAQNTASNILSESELLRAVREKAAKIQEQLKETCDEMKTKAAEEADEIRRNAQKDASTIREGAQAYAEKVLTDLAHDVDYVQGNIEQIRKTIRNGRDYISQSKANMRSGQRPVPKQQVMPEKQIAEPAIKQ